MKKILLSGLILLSSNLFAGYELFVTYTKPLSSVKQTNKQLLYTGDFNKYQKQFIEFSEKYANGTGQFVASTATMGVAAGVAQGVGGAVTGLGVGLAAGLLTPVIVDMQSDQLFIRVEKIGTDKNFTLKRILMIGDKHPSYSEAQANAIMEGGK